LHGFLILLDHAFHHIIDLTCITRQFYNYYLYSFTVRFELPKDIWNDTRPQQLTKPTLKSYSLTQTTYSPKSERKNHRKILANTIRLWEANQLQNLIYCKCLNYIKWTQCWRFRKIFNNTLIYFKSSLCLMFILKRRHQEFFVKRIIDTSIWGFWQLTLSLNRKRSKKLIRTEL
jgi:hypothetical protein